MESNRKHGDALPRPAWMRRGIACFVAIVFTVTTLAGSPAQALALTQATENERTASSLAGYEKTLYALPPELGSLSSFWKPQDEISSQNLVIHIQDAHANPEAQRNIAGILQYLTKQYPDLSIGVEGAAGPLHPEYLQFFRGFPDADHAVVEDLLQKGELNGAELYLLQKERSTADFKPSTQNVEAATVSVLRPAVAGVENVELYHKNLKTFQELLAQRHRIQTYLAPIRSRLETEASRVLNADLRNFLTERRHRKEGRYYPDRVSGDLNLLVYTGYLKKQAAKSLQIDLKDPFEQLRFPNLVRIVQVGEVQKGFDVAKAQEDWKQVLAILKKASHRDAEKKFVSALESFAKEKGMVSTGTSESMSARPVIDTALYPRQLLEQLFLFSKKVSFSGHDAFFRSFELFVLQAEIEVSELSSEMASLETMLIERMARTEAEKQLVYRLGTLDLLEKLLYLELTREEYQQALTDRTKIASFVKDPPALQVLLSRAYFFYETTLRRDRVLVENALALSLKPGNQGKSPVVLITGGFHAAGIDEILRERRIPYATLTPHISSTDRGELYQKVMAGDHADLKTYFGTRNPFATKQEALIFKEMVEVAAPAFFEKKKMTPARMSTAVTQAVKEHPILSSAVVTRALSGASNVLQFVPRSVLPQNSTISAADLLGGASSQPHENPSRALAVPEVGFAGPGHFTIKSVPAGVAQRSEMRGEDKDPTEVPEKLVPAEGTTDEIHYAGGVTIEKSVHGKAMFFSPPKHSISWSIPNSVEASRKEREDYYKWYAKVHELLEQCLPPEVAKEWNRIIREKKNVWLPEETESGGLKVHLIARIVAAIEADLEAKRFAELQMDPMTTGLFRMILEDQLRIFALEAWIRDEKIKGTHGKGDFLKEQQPLLHRIIDVKKEQYKIEREGLEGRLRGPLSTIEKNDVVLLIERIRSYEGILDDLLATKSLFQIEKLTPQEFADLGPTLATPIVDKIVRSWKGLYEKSHDASQDESRRDEKFYHWQQMQYDTGSFLRNIVMEFVEAFEGRIPHFKREEVETEDKTFEHDALILVVDQFVEERDIRRIIHKYHGRIAGIVAGFGGTNSHWVQIIKSSEGAPPIFNFKDTKDIRKSLGAIREGEDLVIQRNKRSGGWSLILNPATSTLESVQNARRTESLLAEGQDALLPFPADVSVKINLTDRDAGSLDKTGAKGSGLIRTDQLDPEAERYLLNIAQSIAEGKAHLETVLQALQGFHADGPNPQWSRVRSDFMARLDRDLVANIQALLGNRVGRYGALVHDPFFQGREVPFRTLDLQDDSKGKGLIQALVAIAIEHPQSKLLIGIPEEVASDNVLLTKAIRGFDFYRRTTIGKFFLTLQMASFLLAYSNYLEQSRISDVPEALFAKLQIFFPMVSSVEDVEFIRREILPAAQTFAAISLNPSEAWDSKALKESYKKIKTVVSKTQFGIMVEVPSILKDQTLARALVRNDFISFFGIGTNDLEALLAGAKLGREVSRDDPEAQQYFGFLSEKLKDGLDSFFNIVRREAPQKTVCICGALGSDEVFQLYIQYWRRRGLLISTSGGKPDVSPSHDRFLLYRGIPEAQLRYLYESGLPESEREEKARVLARATRERAKPFLVWSAFFQRRFKEAGFLQGSYHDLIDPSYGIGSFYDVLILLKLLQTEGQTDMVDPETELQQLSKKGLVPETMHSMIDRLVERGTLPESERESLWNALVFLQHIWSVHQGRAQRDATLGFKLAGKMLTDFINDMEGKGTFPWLSKGTDRQRRDDFYAQYFKSANMVRDLIFNVIHERYQDLYGEGTEDMGPVLSFRSEVRNGEKISEWSGEVRLRRRRGMMTKQDDVLGYQEVLELYLPIRYSPQDQKELAALSGYERQAKETAIFLGMRGQAIEYFRDHPAAIAQIFRASGWHNGREIRISYPLRQVLREAIQAFAGLEKISPVLYTEIFQANGEFIKLMREKGDISYPVWRMCFFGFLDHFFPGFHHMVDYFPGEGRKIPAHLQTLNAFKFLEELPRNDDFAFQRAKNVLNRYQKNPPIMAMLRISLLIHGIVRARFQRTKETPSEAVIRDSVTETLKMLGVEWPDPKGENFSERTIGLDSKESTIKLITWLIQQEMFFQDRDLLTSGEVRDALRHLVEKGGRVLEAKDPDLDLLYLLIFATRVGRADQEKRVIMRTQGSDSALANWDRFYEAAEIFLKSKGGGFWAARAQGRTESLDWDDLVSRAGAVVRDGDFIGADGKVEPLPGAPSRQDLWKEFKEHYEEGLYRYKASNLFSKGLDELAENVAGTFEAFCQRYDAMEQLMTSYYLRTLDPERRVMVLLLFLNLNLFEKKHDTRAMLTFNPLSHQYKDRIFEIFFTRAFPSPGFLAIFSRILKERGFNIEEVGLAQDQDRMVTRFLGSFVQTDVDPEQAFRAIAQDLEEIFVKDEDDVAHFKGTSRDRMGPWFGRVIGFLWNDKHVSADLFRKLYARFGALEVYRPVTSELEADTQVAFVEDRRKKSGEFSTFMIETEDRPGLTAFLADFFAIRGIHLVNFHFDDTLGKRPRILVHINDAVTRKMLSKQERDYILKNLKKFLDAPGVRIQPDFALRSYKIEMLPAKEKPQSEKPPVQDPGMIATEYGTVPARMIHADVSSSPVEEVPLAPEMSDLVQERQYQVTGAKGLHARMAAKVAELAQRYSSVIPTMTLTLGALTENMTGVLDLLSLGAQSGSMVTARIEADRQPIAEQAVEGFWRELEAIVEEERNPLFARVATKIKQESVPEQPISPMEERSYQVTGTLGLHGRIAGKIRTLLVEEYPEIGKVTLISQNSELNMATDIVELMMLMLSRGKVVTIRVEIDPSKPLAVQQRTAFWKALEELKESMDGSVVFASMASKGRSEVRENRQPLGKKIQKILVVDDEAAIPMLVSFLFPKAQGFEVVTAASGEEALKKLKIFTPDIILSDVHMPGMTGLKMAVRISKMPGLGQVPIMFITGGGKHEKAFDKVVEKLSETHPVHVLPKPIETAYLKKLLAKPDKYFKHWPVRSEIRDEVERPLDKIPADQVKKIFIFGHKGHGQEKLGEDLILYAHFVPLLLNKFPNAQVHLAIDYQNIFSAERYRGRVFPIGDALYPPAGDLHGKTYTEPMEPRDGMLPAVPVPAGVIRDAIASFSGAEALAKWVVDEDYDMVFDFSASRLSPHFETMRSKKTPVTFSNMHRILSDTGSGFHHHPLPFELTMRDGNGVHRVKGMESIYNLTRDLKRPVFWEIFLRVYRAMGLLPDHFDLQTVDQLLLPLHDEEKKWAVSNLMSLLLRKGMEPDAAKAEILKGRHRFVYVNIFSKSSVNVLSETEWVDLLKGFFIPYSMKDVPFPVSASRYPEDVYLVFSPGGFKDHQDRMRLDRVLRRLEAVIGHGKSRYLLVAPDNLSIGGVQRLMQAMDAVITPDTGFSHLATSLNIPQVEFLLFPKFETMWRTYRNNSFVVDSEYLAQLREDNGQYAEAGLARIHDFINARFAETPLPRKNTALKITAVASELPRRSEQRSPAEQYQALESLQTEILKKNQALLEEIRKIDPEAIEGGLSKTKKNDFYFWNLLRLINALKVIKQKAAEDHYADIERILSSKQNLEKVLLELGKAPHVYDGAEADGKILSQLLGRLNVLEKDASDLRTLYEQWESGPYRYMPFPGFSQSAELQDYIFRTMRVWLLNFQRVIEGIPLKQTSFQDKMKALKKVAERWADEPVDSSVVRQENDPRQIIASLNQWSGAQLSLFKDQIMSRPDKGPLSDVQHRELVFLTQGLEFILQASEQLTSVKPVSSKPAKEQLMLLGIFPQRSELRGTTAAGKQMLRTKDFGPVEALIPEDAIPEIDFAAKRTGGLYSEEGLTKLTGNAAKARLWIAMKLIETMGAETEGRITSPRLREFLDHFMASVPVQIRTLASRDVVTGPQLHVNLAGLEKGSWAEFIRNFPVVLGLLVTLRASLSINVDVQGSALRSIQAQFNDLMAQEGIVLAPDQLRIVSATGSDHFRSFEGQKEADAFMARNEKFLLRRRNVKSYWVTEDGNHMDTLTAGIATALLEVASDERLTAAHTYKPSQYATLLEAVMNAIQGYLRIRTAA